MSLHLLQNFVKDFNPKLEESISNHLSLYPHPVVTDILSQVVPISSGGKRVRPYLTYLMDDSANQDINHPIYESIELIHLFALVHDDIMDECDTRRGELTVHAKARSSYGEQRPNKQKLISDSIAILAGDMIFSLSEERFNKSLASQAELANFQKAHQLFCELKQQVIYGQLLDLHLTSQSTATEQEVYDKTFYKTASYTIVKPMQIGCALAGRHNLLDFCHEFGQALGVGFQIQDDYINLAISEDITGKPQYSDVSEGQKTFFTTYLQDHADQSYLEYYQSLLDKKDLSKEEQDNLKNILSKSGALQAGKEEYEKLFDEAQMILEKNKSSLTDESYKGLHELVEYLKFRKK